MPTRICEIEFYTLRLKNKYRVAQSTLLIA